MATNPALTQQASRRRDDEVVTSLVTRTRNGDRQAWDALVDRYAPLIWSICRRHRLEAADAEDAAQNVWLKLVDHLDSLRDPAALPGWLATTTRRECGRIARTARRPCDARSALAAGTISDDHAQAAGQDLLAAERHAALREAFGQLPPGCQQLIALLIEDPALSYAEISARLGIPAGSIGPTRRRCLDKLRRHPAITALINAGTQTAALSACSPRGIWAERSRRGRSYRVHLRQDGFSDGQRAEYWGTENVCLGRVLGSAPPGYRAVRQRRRWPLHALVVPCSRRDDLRRMGSIRARLGRRQQALGLGGQPVRGGAS